MNTIGQWIDGIESQSLPADDRGLQYGDGLFETILVRGGVPRFLAAHLARLQRGLAQLRIAAPAEAELQADIRRALTLAPPLAILKIIVTRGTAPRRGYAPAREGRARRIVSLWTTQPLSGEQREQGVELDLAGLRIAEYSPFAGLKHLNRLENVMAAAEIAAPAFDVLMLNTRQDIVSTSAANVFLCKGGEVLTPPVDRNGVAGVLRSIVLREAPRLGLALRETRLTLDDLRGADGMFITNARIGVVPVRRVREHVFGMTGVAQPLARLREVIEALDA